MTLPTHILAGLVIGKLTGNYSLSVAGSILIDVDHVFSYVKNGVLFKPKKFLQTVFNKDDPYGDQRFLLHNVLVFLLISGVVFLINHQIGFVFGLAYLSHLILDALDNSDYFPFFPNKKMNIRGPIKYFSKQEFFVMIFLGVVFLLI